MLLYCPGCPGVQYFPTALPDLGSQTSHLSPVLNLTRGKALFKQVISFEHQEHRNQFSPVLDIFKFWEIMYFTCLLLLVWFLLYGNHGFFMYMIIKMTNDKKDFQVQMTAVTLFWKC